MEQEKIIISLGGSLIVPNEIDIDFLTEFKKIILSQIEKGKKFIIITGGGKIARKYQSALKEISNPSLEHLDWLGIYSTRLNAEFLGLFFTGTAEEKIITDPTLPVNFEKPLIIGAGWKPGWSTDYDAVLLAKSINAKRVINLSNIDFAYDKDPNKYPDAKKLENISWSEYRELIPKEWNPGLSTPFDPIASGVAESEGIEVAILNGKNIENLENCLNNLEFIGTKIK
ncbi:MAG: UMP kinase [Candidatus Nomurabacteria bacterium]|nr:UMP kinase [Candidatus Nomurabacteria bacterium]